MIRYHVVHTTRYDYELPVSLGHNEVRLIPRSFSRQDCQHSQLLIQPTPAVCHDREDFFGNHVTYFAIQEPHTTLEITANSKVQIVSADVPDLSVSSPWEEARQVLYRDPSPFDIQDS